MQTHPPSDYLNARVNKVCRYGLDIERNDMNRLNKEMHDRYGNLVRRYKIKYQAIISAEFPKYNKDEPVEVDNSIISKKQITNLTKF